MSNSPWQCTYCCTSFSRAEHLRRHLRSHENLRPFACGLCRRSFTRKDLLKRHERTCRVRVPEDVVAPANLQSDQLDQQSGWERAFVSSWSTRDGDLHDLPSSVDFASLDFLFAPPLASDSITVAERLEYLAYFTSANGMATFLDRETLKQRQELLKGAARHSHERIYEEAHYADLLPETIEPSLIHLSSSSHEDILVHKAHKITQHLHRTITTKSDRTVIKLDWSPAVQQSCSTFFSASNIRRFLEYFWSLWYPNCPIVHRPSFDPQTAPPALLCVMLIIGACLSPHEEDTQAAKMWLDSVEEMAFSDECFMEKETSHVPIGLYATAEWMKKRVECIQTAYLVCSLQKREGSVEAQGRVRRHRHATMVMLARDIGLESATHRSLRLESPCESWWRQFIIEEELIRTLMYVFLIDAAMAILHQTPPRMVVSELKMDMACPEACFQADTATECFHALRKWQGCIFWAERVSVAGVVRRICQRELDDSSVLEFSKMGTLNLFTTVQALHSLMFHLQNSLVFESTLVPVQTGLENWRRIWNARQPEDKDIPDEPQTIWKKIGFVRYAPEFWHLARIIVARMASDSDEQSPLPTEQGLSRFDHTDMSDINGLIMEYRQLNLGVPRLD